MSDDAQQISTTTGRRLRPVQSLVRAIDLLDALAEADRPLGITDLATITGISKTAAYNLVVTLELRGLIRRDEGNRYLLGWRMLELGEQVRTHSALSEAARSHLVELSEATGETVFIAILDSDAVFCVDMVESPRSIPIAVSPGRRVALEDTAAGLVLLAHAAPRRRRRYAQARPKLGTEHELLDQFAAIRAAGHVISLQDVQADLASVAVPITDLAGEQSATLALQGPRIRLTETRMQGLVQALEAQARAISTALSAIQS